MTDAAQMVRDLVRERLATEPHAAHLAVTHPMFAAALTWMQATLEAVVNHGRSEEWSDAEIAACVRGALSRLLRDDLLALAEDYYRLADQR